MDDADPRFVQSFGVDEAKEILQFFDEYGFVVVRDILTPLECQVGVVNAFRLKRDERQSVSLLWERDMRRRETRR
jgi:hypothetical protein